MKKLEPKHDDGHEHARAHHHHHDCGNLFGCADEKGTGIIREDIKDAAFDKRASDRLLHMDEVNQETFDGYLSERGRWRRKFLQASSFMGALAAVEPWFAKLARAQGGDAGSRPPHTDGRVPRLGPELPEVCLFQCIDCGDVLTAEQPSANMEIDGARNSVVVANPYKRLSG